MDPSTSAIGGVNWRESQIKRAKEQIKAEIEAQTAGKEPRLRLDFIQRQLRVLEDDQSSQGLLYRFVYIVSALVHHERFGGVGDRDIAKMMKVAEAILKTEGIRAGKSRLSYLYGELHLIMSQIYRQRGAHWRAAWEQQQCEQQAKPEPPGGVQFQALSMANRLMRLGHAQLAMPQYVAAEVDGMSNRPAQLARLGRIRALRLSGMTAAAKSLIEATLGDPAFDKRIEGEVAWELICLQATQSQDLSAMVSAVRRGGSHYFASYVVEAFLWAHCSPHGEWTQRLTSMKTIARNKELNPQSLGFTFECAQVLEAASDREYPLRYRQQRLAEILTTTNDLLGVDKEMLVWAAAGRLLAGMRSWTLATIAIKEYQALCRRLADGAAADTLRVVDDLVVRDWFSSGISDAGA